MDIHKPKPVHSFREFLNEIAVIIVGVLIALGLEQAVESWHHAEQVEQARETLKEELAVNLAGLRHTQRNSQCYVDNSNRLIALIDAGNVAKVRQLAAQENAGNPGFTSQRERFRIISLRTRAWEAANASGLLAYMSPSETLKFSAAYSVIDTEKRYRSLFSDKYTEAWSRAEIFDGSHADAQAIKLLLIEQRDYWASRIGRPFPAIIDVIGEAKPKDASFLKMLLDCEPIKV